MNSWLVNRTSSEYSVIGLAVKVKSTSKPSMFSGSSKMVSIKTDKEFNTVLKKVQDESLSAIFYYTASWCGPCRYILPLINKWSVIYPHVTTYKIDIGEVGLKETLARSNVASVPTLQFYRRGVKASEVVGADIARLNAIMQSLYE